MTKSANQFSAAVYELGLAFLIDSEFVLDSCTAGLI
jgi:hypothetical protein